MSVERLFSDLFRSRGNHHQRVTFVELFFDLVYVFAITQLSHLLIEHLSWRGAFQTLLLTFAVWWGWIYTAWMTNWLDPDKRPVRIALIGVMLASLIMSAMIPEAFGERGLPFAIAFVLMQVGRCLFILRACRGDEVMERNFQRILVWMCISAVPWLLGGFAEGSTRELLWLLAVGIDLCGPISGFITPRLGRTMTHDLASISGGHFAERCQLFLIISLGESILTTGGTLAVMEITFWMAIAFVTAFIGSVTLWWVYFDRSASDSAERIAESDDPGRMARDAYTYIHLVIVAGIIVTAVGDERAIAHPTGDADIATVLVVMGGPTLFLLGHLLFKRLVWGHLSRQRLVAIAALLAMIPVGRELPPVFCALIAALIVIGVVLWDMGFRFSSLIVGRRGQLLSETSGVGSDDTL